MIKKIASFVLLISGCASVPPYVPQIVSQDQAIKNINRCLRQQPGDLAPVRVEVTPEYMSTVVRESTFSLKIGGGHEEQVPSSVYFDRIGTLKLDHDEGAFVGIVTSKDGDHHIRCYNKDVELVRGFLDGANSLKNYHELQPNA